MSQHPPSALLLLFLSVFVDLIGLGIIIPLLPFIAGRYGAGPTQITLLFALYSFMQFLLTPIWGNLSDRLGRRPILLLSFLGSGTAYLWFALANSLTMLFAARALAGAMGSSFTVAQAYVADVTTPDQRAKGMGMIGAAFGCGFTIGPALGGLLAGMNAATPNFQLPLLVAAGLSFVSLLFAFLKLPEPRRSSPLVLEQSPGQSDRSLLNLQQVRQVLHLSQVRYLIGILFLFSLATVGTQPVLMLWCDSQFGWGPQSIGFLLMFFGLISISIQGGLIGVLSKRFSERHLLMVGVIAQGLGLLMLPMAKAIGSFLISVSMGSAGDTVSQTALSHQLAIGLLVLSSSIWIAGEAMSRPALSSLLSRSAMAAQQGTTLGVAQSLGALARIVGPIWAGYIYATVSGAWSFWSGALIMVFAIFLSVQIRQPHNTAASSPIQEA